MFSDTDRAAASSTWANDKAAAILDFSKGFSVFDEEYFQKVVDFEASLDAA